MTADGAWVTIALLGKTRGNRGELTAVALSSKPERYASLREVHLFNRAGESAGTRCVENTWFHDGRLVIKFAGIDSIADAEPLIGCEVIERPTGERLGRVAALDDSGTGGLLVLEDGLMIPFARAICVEIDPAARRIAVELPAGLKDLNRP